MVHSTPTSIIHCVILEYEALVLSYDVEPKVIYLGNWSKAEKAKFKYYATNTFPFQYNRSEFFATIGI